MTYEPRKVFILGSSASSDALAKAGGRFEVIAYLARTSLTGIGMRPISEQKLRGLVSSVTNPLERQLLMNDLDKTTESKLAETRHELLLLDFIDERFDLVLSGASLFSLSGELAKLGLDFSRRKMVSPGSRIYLELWLAGLDRLLLTADTGKVVLNKLYWADRFPDGREAFSRSWIQRNNDHLQRLYDTADKYWDLPKIEYPPELLMADPNHRWGVAPYHYIPGLYAHTVSELARITGMRAP